MIIPLNRSVVAAEVFEWARYRIAKQLQCPVGAVEVKVAVGEKGPQLIYRVPGLDNEALRDELATIHYRAKKMLEQRLAGLKTRRSR